MAKITETVAAYRLKELQYLQAREQLATWRRTHGYDRDDSWMHGTLLLSPQEFTASLLSELNALRDIISMPEGDRFSPRAKSFIKETGQGTVNSTDGIGQSIANMSGEEFTILRRLVEKRDREAAQVTATAVSTAQHCIPRSLNPEVPSDVYVNMEEKDEGRMNPELTELKPPSAGTGIEATGQQCPPNEGTWETGRTIADGYLLVGMRSNQRGDISSPKERVGTRAGTATTPASSSNTIFRKASRKPEDKTPSEENKQFDPGGKGEKSSPWNAAVILFFFPGGSFGPWEARSLCFVFFVFVYLSICSLFIVRSGEVITFLAS